MKTQELPEIDLTPLARMTDGTGLFHRPTFTVASSAEGYCTDDNARAFILAMYLEELEEEPTRARRLAETYAAFLRQAFNPKTKRFHNFMAFDRHWQDEQGSEDTHGRALWALGTGVGRTRHQDFRAQFSELFMEALPSVTKFRSPRAWAFTLLGINEYLQVFAVDAACTQMRDLLTSRLLELFIKTAHHNWHWFEDILAHDNAKLAHALIASGSAPGHKTALDCGLHTLHWLVEMQTTKTGHFRPLGNNGFYRRGQGHAIFDQQPVEAYAMISACIQAYRVTANQVWHEHAQRAFDWFQGWNDPEQTLFTSTTIAHHDVLHVDGLDASQGVESRLSYLLSLAEMKLANNLVTTFNAPMV